MADSIELVFYNHFEGRETFELPKGSRPWHIALLITEGAFEIESNNKSIKIEKNEIAFFPRNTYFERRIISPISFHQFGFFLDNEERYPLPKGSKLALPKSHVRACAETLDALSATRPQSIIDGALCSLQSILFEHSVYEKQNAAPTSDRDGDISFVINYMMEHLSENIRVQQLADTLHISRVGLLEKFKKHMGCTLSDFLIGLRMSRAKYLLLESNMRINEIASACGYNNAYYFSGAFKKINGQTPLEYRRNRLKKLEEKNRI